jgi:hypothetical protein
MRWVYHRYQAQRETRSAHWVLIWEVPVLSFISTNLDELIQDIPVPCFHLSRDMLLGLNR